MSGLNLRMGAGVSYAPLTPASASPSTATSTISQAAYGINGSGMSNGSQVAGMGSVIVGAIALAALIYMWWSLPR